MHRPRLLILDEPTSALSETEADRLFGVIRHLRDDGVAVLYVSHRLAEIDSIADRLVVLRDGAIRSAQLRPSTGRRRSATCSTLTRRSIEPQC